MLITAAFDGASVGNFLSDLCEVYIVVILLYILISIALNAGLRPPYSRAFDVLMTFLREVCEPYLGLFRKFIRPIGPLDLSPLFAIIVLIILEQVIANVFGS